MPHCRRIYGNKNCEEIYKNWKKGQGPKPLVFVQFWIVVYSFNILGTLCLKVTKYNQISCKLWPPLPPWNCRYGMMYDLNIWSRVRSELGKRLIIGRCHGARPASRWSDGVQYGEQRQVSLTDLIRYWCFFATKWSLEEREIGNLPTQNKTTRSIPTSISS